MDDILIFTPTLEEHCRVTREILETLRSHQLFLKLEKCKFECKSVEYLGLIISQDHVAMDPVKICGVIEWPQPTKVKEVQSFLGFVNFYRRFVKNFSDIVRPLHALTRKSKRWSWGKDEQDAFEALKHAVTSAPVLIIPSDSGKFCLECDALNYATGAVLSQLQDDGHFHPVGFMSKGFANVQQNYPIHDKEMLAIMRALEEWWHFLEGTPERFNIFTDHKNLTYFRDAQKLIISRPDGLLTCPHYTFPSPTNLVDSCRRPMPSP